MDLGFKGTKYTWINKHFKNKNSLIHERLDCFFANQKWLLSYPNSQVVHLPRTHSDQCPHLLNLDAKIKSTMKKIFRFDTIWTSHPNLIKIISSSWQTNSKLEITIPTFEKVITHWNKETFDDIFKKKKTLLNRINGIQKSPNYPHSSFLHTLERDSLRNTMTS